MKYRVTTPDSYYNAPDRECFCPTTPLQIGMVVRAMGSTARLTGDSKPLPGQAYSQDGRDWLRHQMVTEDGQIAWVPAWALVARFEVVKEEPHEVFIDF